jgi:hypothetical protein
MRRQVSWRGRGMHSMPLRRGGWPRLAWTYLRTPRFSPLRLTRDNRSVLAFNLSLLATRADLLRRGMEQLLAWADAGTSSRRPDSVREAANHRTRESPRPEITPHERQNTTDKSPSPKLLTVATTGPLDRGIYGALRVAYLGDGIPVSRNVS